MNPTRAFYSVVQYVPDDGRAEAANAGVVLLVPSEKRIEVRTSPTLARVRHFFAPGKVQLRRLELQLESLRNRLESARGEFENEKDFADFIAARANTMRLTPPRLVVVEDPLRDGNELYAELVGDPEPKAFLAAGCTLPRPVAEVFGRLKAEGRLRQPESILVPTTKRKFEVAAAYENGVLNFVRPEPLTQGAKLETRLAKLGFNGRLIHRHEIDGKRARLIVLSSSRDAKPETEDEFETALEEFDVRFIRYGRAAEFAAEVDKTAH